LRGEVLGGNQVDEVLLAGFLLELVSALCPAVCPESDMTYLLEDIEDGRIGVLQGGRQELEIMLAWPSQINGAPLRL
jgi:hypothetical protein